MKETSISSETKVPLGWIYATIGVLASVVIMVATYAFSISSWKTTVDLRLDAFEKNSALQEKQLEAMHEMNSRLSNIEGQLLIINSRGNQARQAVADEIPPRRFHERSR